MDKVAIIGLGNWGKNLLTTFNDIADVSVSCTTGDQENLDWLNKNFPKIKHTANSDNIINNKTINAVVIATPIDTHYELAKKALTVGKHVFVEKPLSTNLEQAKELFELAKEKDLILFTGNVFLYNDIFSKIEKLNEKYPFDYIQFYWNKFGTFTENIFWNLAWHDITMIIKLMGKPTDIQLVSTYGFFTNNDIVNITLSFSHSKSSTISINRMSNITNKNILFISKEKVFNWNNDFLYSLKKNLKEFKKIFEPTNHSLSIESRKFISLINKEESKINDAELILETIKTIGNLINQSHGN